MSTLTIPLSSIDLEQRRDFGDLSGLQESLERLGTIHPPVLSAYVTPAGETRYLPIAGRRRLTALTLNGVKFLHHNSVLDPDLPGFMFREDVPEDILREAELDENLHRLKPKWTEDVLLIADVHALKRAKHGSSEWGQRQTAALLGKGYSKSNINTALKVAALIRANDPDILECDNLTEANVVRLKRLEDEALSLLTKRHTEWAQQTQAETVPVKTNTLLQTFIMAGTSTPDAPTIPVPIIQFAPVTVSPTITIPLTSMFVLGKMEEVQWPRTNHVVTDIPYGIDMDNVTSVNLADVRDTHNVADNLALMPIFLQRAFDSILPGGFCAFCYDLDHHEKLQTWARDIGWKVQRWPISICKTSSCSNQTAQFNTTKNVEHLMLLRRDATSVLRHNPAFTFNNSSYQTYDFATERRLYNNAFAKPFALWKDIYDMIAFPGQTVHDPFCGEMSSSRAAAHCMLVPSGSEISEPHYQRGLENMRKTYATIHKSNVLFS